MSIEERNQSHDNTEVIRCASALDCGGRCPLRVHVEDGVVVCIEGKRSGFSKCYRILGVKK